MSWLSKLFGINGRANGVDTDVAYPPEDVFIEKNTPNGDATSKDENEVSQDNIHMVYAFLSKDYQQIGYDDALVHPDMAFRNEKVREIQGDLDIVLRKSKTFYEDAIRELDFLIASRNRIGMVDVVDELKMRKDKAAEHYKKILEIEKEAIQQGEAHRLVISYNRGFQNGMGAIAIHESNKRQF